MPECSSASYTRIVSSYSSQKDNIFKVGSMLEYTENGCRVLCDGQMGVSLLVLVNGLIHELE